MSRRIRIRLSGGPFDRCIIFGEPGTFEAGLADAGEIHLYEVKGTWGSYIGPRPMAIADEDGPSVGPWPGPGEGGDNR